MAKKIEEEKETAGKRLILGVDLGTSRTAVMSSRGAKQLFRTVVGYPKDIIGLKLLGHPYVVGEDALEKRSFLDVKHPLEDGVLREFTERDIEIARHLMAHLVKVSKAREEDELCAIIGVPARASAANKGALLNLAKEVMSTALVVSEPFMVAYGLGKLLNTIIIDIGAGTTDLCGLRGAVPDNEDQITLTKAGNYVDERLRALIEEAHPGVQINKYVACDIKEQHAFVGEAKSPVEVELRRDGRPATVDVTAQVRTACESLVPDILESIEYLVRRFQPEDQPTVLKNIVLAGGGSRIKGLDTFLTDKLSVFGPVKVSCAPDPTFDGCNGALKLAQELPPQYWSELGDKIG
ncbi:MAG: rod shape-determining protein [Alphaproteobacteria bacterium]|nr:rod shape-determining protein [Alphaproteobacteria bacterium]MBF0250891.1 rod shape-determining protein [Alphaproteobacteria bacterium]